MSLFSNFQIFDFMNFFIFLFFFIFLKKNYFIFSSFSLLNFFLPFLFKELKSSSSFFSPKGEIVFFLSLFFFLFFSNFFSLFTYVFAFSSQLSFSLFISLSFFLGILMWGLSQNIFVSLSHLAPKGSPLFLLPILVLIESMSWLIRPFTLSIRLSANILAGHILMQLASLLLINGIFFLIILFALEVFVSFIQAFVFVLLLMNYKLDVSI